MQVALNGRLPLQSEVSFNGAETGMQGHLRRHTCVLHSPAPRPGCHPCLCHDHRFLRCQRSQQHTESETESRVTAVHMHERPEKRNVDLTPSGLWECFTKCIYIFLVFSNRPNGY